MRMYSQEEKVYELASKKRKISNKDVQDLLGVSLSSANVLLSGMVKKQLLVREKGGEYMAR